MAGPALQPALRRRPARERAHRHDLHRQLLHLPDSGPGGRRQIRFWRDTSIADLEAGQTATLPDGTLGYEWDEDLDNSVRPPGHIRMSSTTEDVPQRILDHGSNYGPGEATHHLTLYRHQSGALVFGAGTTQWPWGLDSNDDRSPNPSPDPDMQQATVNLFADMGAQPETLQTGLVTATASTDTSPPSTQIDTPNNGAEVESGQSTTISGTATDAGGGEVGGVEVSVDNGNTWHPAEGRGNWTYDWTPDATGNTTIKVRAADDSGNLENPGPGVTVDVVPRACPCSIWDNSVTPPLSNDSASPDGSSWGSSSAPTRTGSSPGSASTRVPNTGTHVGHLWEADGTMLAEATFTGESASGWRRSASTTRWRSPREAPTLPPITLPRATMASAEQDRRFSGEDVLLGSRIHPTSLSTRSPGRIPTFLAQLSSPDCDITITSPAHGNLRNPRIVAADSQLGEAPP